MMFKENEIYYFEATDKYEARHQNGFYRVVTEAEIDIEDSQEMANWFGLTFIKLEYDTERDFYESMDHISQLNGNFYGPLTVDAIKRNFPKIASKLNKRMDIHMVYCYNDIVDVFGTIRVGLDGKDTDVDTAYAVLEQKLLNLDLDAWDESYAPPQDITYVFEEIKS